MAPAVLKLIFSDLTSLSGLLLQPLHRRQRCLPLWSLLARAWKRVATEVQVPGSEFKETRCLSRWTWNLEPFGRLRTDFWTEQRLAVGRDDRPKVASFRKTGQSITNSLVIQIVFAWGFPAWLVREWWFFGTRKTRDSLRAGPEFWRSRAPVRATLAWEEGLVAWAPL